MLQRYLYALCISLSFVLTTSSQDVVISEVLYNPISGNEKVKLTNTTAGTINVSNYWLCSQVTYRRLGDGLRWSVASGSLNILAGQSVVVENISTAWLPNAADLGLYSTGVFGPCENMVDFVQWGGSFDFPAGRENVAVAACLWVDEAFAPPVAAPGEALFFDGSNTGVTSCSTCASGSYTDGTFVTATSDLSNSTTTLPVDLIDFTGSRIGSRVFLRWKTTSEENSDRFEVQRSTDRRAFATIGTVLASGNSQAIQNYEFEDFPSAKPHTIYYRLNQLDRDGRSEFSPIVAIKLDGSSDVFNIEIYPNPVSQKDFLKIHWTGLNSETVLDVEMYSISGQKVVSHRSKLGQFDRLIELPVGALKPSVYQLIVRSDGTVLKQLPVLILD